MHIQGSKFGEIFDKFGKKSLKNVEFHLHNPFFNRLGVAGAALQTALLLIDKLTEEDSIGKFQRLFTAPNIPDTVHCKQNTKQFNRHCTLTSIVNCMLTAILNTLYTVGCTL